ncbi:membrane-anchored junction protein isoform X1 [Vombatus ursinus]|uniref:Membrane anchored junction protein n=1 Tax=Vombatus ursinus TaxID=29139 RepID=A0A4X2K0U3_VOMUR|nr:membrane-anchored junction protein isoform X1 [Vombatus ursinus]XP_027712112.1 membrane-anchored junction protein isoform X1 [Vombatus ursinus]
MSLQAFTYPLPETRFLHAGTSLYKFKIRYGSSVRGEEIADKKVVSQELEDSIRAVLGNLDNLQPFTTDHFIIFPYKSKWERVSHLRFKHGAAFLEPYPFVCTLYVEMKWAPAGTSGGDNDFPEMPDAPSADCPPALGQGESQGSGSYLKGHNEEAEVRTVAAKRRRLEGGKFPPGREQGRATMGTSRRKKPSAQTRRNWPGEPASEEEETEDFDTAFLKERGALAGSGSSLGDPKGHPPQTSGLSSPEGPPKPKPAGFWGFLSSLLPFRLFGWRGHQ